MSTSLIFIAGIALCLIALGISAVGMRSPDFPSSGLTRVLLGLGAVVVLVTCTGAVLAARHEQKDRRAETSEKLEEARSIEGERENGNVLRELHGEELAQQTFRLRCGSCHTLSAAGTKGQVGPDLGALKPDVERVEKAIEKGGLETGRMPQHLVKGDEVTEVAKFVASAAK